jgi:kynurenine formamidase
MGTDSRYGAVSFANEQIVLSGHSGTHIDAPFHADPDGKAADEIDLARVVGPATVIGLRHLSGPRHLVSAADLLASLDGRALDGSIVLLDTGWSATLDRDPREYFANSMGLDESAANWLRDRGVTCVGIDAPSVDAPSRGGAPAHMCFLRGDPPIYIVENLVHLDRLPATGALFVAAPLPLAGSSGSPVRAFAIVD